MPYPLKGRNVLVTGGSRGLGEVVSLKFAQEGCNIAINYVSSAFKAEELAAKIEKEHGVKAVMIQGGYTRFSKFSDLSAPSIEDCKLSPKQPLFNVSGDAELGDKCYAVNVKAQAFLMREALPTFNSNPEGGVFLITSSIAGVNISGSSMPYSVTKAAQLHLMRCLAGTQGPKVRVNAILPGLLLTEWGARYPKDDIKMMEGRAWLKKVTDLEDTAQAFVDAAKNSSMTGQKIQVDAGLGNV
ncbi:hypothetical protein B7494_g6675 [Chlorociboria aeruginascens]|nr:hypothetical protein B7494_g6675 [Chlorociboria aeruginascens]